MKDTILEKDTIHVTIGDDHTYNCSVATIGRTGENAVSQLEITIPEELSAFWAYLDFKKPNGEMIKTPRLEIVENKIEFDIPSGVLDKSGNLEVQLVLQSENGEVWKSATKKYVVLKSIGAEDAIPEKEDFIFEVQKVLNETEQCLSEVKEKIEIVSQGRNASYQIKSTGWKRILNVIRATNGTVNLGLANGYSGSDCKQVHTLSFDFSGFVRFPNQPSSYRGVLVKRYENFFGEGDEKFKIKKARIAYPKAGTTFPDSNGKVNYEVTPVNCYIDVYVEIDTSENRTVDFNMNYAGFAGSHNCTPILTETNASDKGMYGEELEFYEFRADEMPYYLKSDMTEAEVDCNTSARFDDCDAVTKMTVVSKDSIGIRVFGKNIINSAGVKATSPKWFPSIPAGVELTVSADISDDITLELFETNEEGTLVNTIVLDKTKDGRAYATFTTTKKVSYARWSCTPGHAILNVQAELGKEPTPYAPYQDYKHYKRSTAGELEFEYFSPTTTIVYESGLSTDFTVIRNLDFGKVANKLSIALGEGDNHIIREIKKEIAGIGKEIEGIHKTITEDVAPAGLVDIDKTIGIHEDEENPEEKTDELLKAVYESMTENTIKHIIVNNGSLKYSTFGGGITFVTIYKTNNKWGCISAIKYAGPSPFEWKRNIVEDIWEDWCWVNPPAGLGAEYRTTEIWEGKPVFVQLVDCGYLPNNGRKSVLHGIPNINQVIRVSGTIKHSTSGGSCALPHWYNVDNYIHVGGETGVVNIYTAGDYSQYAGVVQLWYTKN